MCFIFLACHLLTEPDEEKDPPTIVFFRANPATINRGESSALEFSLYDADSWEIDNGVGSVPGNSGGIFVSPIETTTYRLTARNKYGEVYKECTVEVI